MAFDIDQYRTVQITEGGADVFVEGSITTDIVPADGMGWNITQIEFQFDPVALKSISADGYILWSACRDSKTGVAGYLDTDCFYSGGLVWGLTTSGMFQLDTTFVWQAPPGTVFVEPTMYFQLDSDAVGGAVQSVIRVHYQLVKLSEVEILRILNSQ